MDLEFAFRGLPVGSFETPEYPRAPGRYRYMPFRGPGHFDLVGALPDGPAPCTFMAPDGVVEFIVSSVPEYGVVEIQAVAPPRLLPPDVIERGLVHEIWRDAAGLEMCCLAGTLGENARRQFLDARLIHVFTARSHFEAMSMYNAFLDREPYTASDTWDMEPYPESWAVEQLLTEPSWRQLHAAQLGS